MKKSKRIVLGLLVFAVAVWSLSAVQDARAFDPSSEMEWVATSDWMLCDQNSQATECAEWQTPDGLVRMTCCVPPEALGTSEWYGCAGGGRTRGRTDL